MIYTIDNPKKLYYYYDLEEDLSFTGVVKDKNGIVAYYLNGKYHREDGPAIIYADGAVQYWVNGKKLDICTNEELQDYFTLRMFE